jgi:hypothetical protein
MDSPHNVTEAPQSHFKCFVGGITIEDYFAELRQIENKLNLLLTFCKGENILLIARATIERREKGCPKS